MVYCGDFFQIPPVMSPSVFMEPKALPSSNMNQQNLLDRIGFESWMNIRDVVILGESMRHCEDTEFGACLKRVRQGTSTEKDLIYLNRRVMGPHLESELASFNGGTKHVPLVVRSNDLRCALNWQAVKAISARTGLKPIVCVARIVNSDGKLFTRCDVETFLRTTDNQTSNLPIVLPLFPEMPVRVTQISPSSCGFLTVRKGLFWEWISHKPRTLRKLLVSELTALSPVSYLQFATCSLRYSKVCRRRNALQYQTYTHLELFRCCNSSHQGLKWI